VGIKSGLNLSLSGIEPGLLLQQELNRFINVHTFPLELVASGDFASEEFITGRRVIGTEWMKQRLRVLYGGGRSTLGSADAEEQQGFRAGAAMLIPFGSNDSPRLGGRAIRRPAVGQNLNCTPTRTLFTALPGSAR
jgi:hypothetical protein